MISATFNFNKKFITITNIDISFDWKNNRKSFNKICSIKEAKNIIEANGEPWSIEIFEYKMHSCVVGVGTSAKAKIDLPGKTLKDVVIKNYKIYAKGNYIYILNRNCNVKNFKSKDVILKLGISSFFDEANKSGLIKKMIYKK